MHIRVHINEKECFSQVFTARKILVKLDTNILRKYCFSGSYDMEVELDISEPFSLKLLPFN